jgi:methionine-R-sulfoxide reductase
MYSIRLSLSANIKENNMKLNPLTPEEKHVIEDKGTEAPFTGEYDNFWQEGTYLCRRCNSPLYRSKDKFDAHCGWPAFDQEIPGAVKHIKNSMSWMSGWMEIQCSHCGAHLGHVFKGEKFTKTDTRHCVNSLSMRFVPKGQEGKYELKK